MGTETKKVIDAHKAGKISDVTMIKMAAFKEELEKIALSTSELAGMLLLGGAISAGTYGAKKGIEFIEDKFEEKGKEPLFQQMLQKHPELALEDKEKIRDYYDSIWHFAPHLAKSPFAAGAYIRQAITLDESIGGPNIVSTETLAGIQKAHIQAKKDPVEGFSGHVTTPLTESLKAFAIQPSDIMDRKS
jgi:hypothetical protein